VVAIPGAVSTLRLLRLAEEGVIMDRDQIERFVHDIETWEGSVPYLYLDTRGLPTIGVGFLMKTVDDFLRVPLRFKNEGLRIGPRDATPMEVKHEYHRVTVLGQTTGDVPRHGASFYRAHADLVYLRQSSIEVITEAKLVSTYIPGIVALLPEFGRYPDGPQRALVDLAWNLGVAGIGKFGNLLSCCKEWDWRGAALESHVHSSRPERNKWREEMFLSAIQAKGTP
jgi:GH24 family phage-related lysozyme (muramidase)